jgi:hypothetical protein
MLGKQAKRYLALILIVTLASTAVTVTGWIWRDRTIRLLSLQGSDYILGGAQGQGIFSISMAPERRLGNLELRFRCLIERDPRDVPFAVSSVNSTEELLQACPPVRERLEYFSALGADEYVSVHEVSPTNLEDNRLIVVDFGKVYSYLFDARHDNESLTTYAFLVNSTNQIAGYFEGYSEFLVARGEDDGLLRRGELLEMVRLMSGEETNDYVPEPGPGQFSVDSDLPPWGHISFPEPVRDKPYGATILVKEGRVDTGRLLVTIEPFADGRWFEDGSGYWVVKTERD